MKQHGVPEDEECMRCIREGENKSASRPSGLSPFCLDCGHPLTEADRHAPVCPYCGCV